MAEEEQSSDTKFPTDPGPVFRRTGYLIAGIFVLLILTYFDVLGPLFAGCSGEEAIVEQEEMPTRRAPAAGLPTGNTP